MDVGRIASSSSHRTRPLSRYRCNSEKGGRSNVRIGKTGRAGVATCSAFEADECAIGCASHQREADHRRSRNRGALHHAGQRTLPTAISTPPIDRKSTRLNSSHQIISYAVFCLKKKKNKNE